MKPMALVIAAALATVSPPSGQAIAQAETNSAPNGVSIPSGYRDWGLITVAREEGIEILKVPACSDGNLFALHP